jgi:hypothetical protein
MCCSTTPISEAVAPATPWNGAPAAAGGGEVDVVDGFLVVLKLLPKLNDAAASSSACSM